MLRRSPDLFVRVLLFLAFASLMTVPEGLAQELPRLMELPPAAPGPCETPHGSAVPAPASGVNSGSEARMEARALLLEANQASILGDVVEARRLLRRAAGLDPSSGEIAYRLGRILEEADEPEAALAEYCRHLELAPDGPDVPDVEERVDLLAGAREGGIPASARAAFERGIEAMGRGDPSEAELHFSRALVELPDWPEAHFNRALAYLEIGREASGRADLGRYLELRPGAPHAAAVAARARTLGSGPAYTPRTAFMTGLLLPGMGYVVSGRPRAGALVLGGAGAAAAVALLYTRVDVTCRVPPLEGQCPSGEVAERSEERPFLASGLAAAAVVTVLGAVHASRSIRPRPPVPGMGGAPAPGVAFRALSGDGWDVRVDVEPLGRWGAEGVEATFRIRF